MIPGEGPQPALGMIVGEAPSVQDVREGRLFAGRSGRTLDAVLRAVGVARDSVFSTNVVKVVPLDPEGLVRRPSAEEIEEWRPILEAEMTATAPAAILALGQTAARTLTGLEGEIPYGSKIGSVYVAWHPTLLERRSAVYRSSGSDTADWIEQIRPWAEAISE